MAKRMCAEGRYTPDEQARAREAAELLGVSGAQPHTTLHPPTPERKLALLHSCSLSLSPTTPSPPTVHLASALLHAGVELSLIEDLCAAEAKLAADKRLLLWAAAGDD